jgi:gliding motility-associated-like protein
MRSRIFLTAIGILMVLAAFAQPTVITNLTLEEYVNDYLLGNGIQATNITYSGAPIQIGVLENGIANGLPIEAGLVLSTEAATNLDCSPGFIEFGEGINGEPDLLTIANSVPPLIGQNFNVNGVLDVCILEFDFVATGDTMSFNYIFGSDEYLTFVNTQYNDIFAFFLSGPGITGPYASPAGFPNGAINIASLPNTTPPLPITISSVNNIANSEYYIDHAAGSPNDIPTCLNGNTVSLRAVSEVLCGETYHIKLAIADGSDTALASYVMLEAGSFESTTVVEVALSIDVGGDNLFEDCGEGLLTFTRPVDTDIEQESMVLIDYSGTAINGEDFTLLPDTIIFPIGVYTLSFPLDAFEDGVAEGVENVTMQIVNIAACDGIGVTSYFEFTITDEPEPLVVNDVTVNFCNGVPVELIPSIEGGYGVFSYEWSNNDTDETIFVTEFSNTTYSVIVSDTCGMSPDDGVFTLVGWPALELELVGDVISNGQVELGCDEFGSIDLITTGGSGDFSYYWYNQNGNNLFGFEQNLFVGSWNGDFTINVDVTDESCGNVETLTINQVILLPPMFLTLPQTLQVNCGTLQSLTVGIEGGQAPYQYNWYVDNVFQSNAATYNFTALNDATIACVINDACGQEQAVFLELTVLTPEVVVSSPTLFEGTCVDEFNITANAAGGSGGITYQWSDATGVFSTEQAITYQSDVDVVLTVTATDICGTQATSTTAIQIVNPMLVVDLGQNIFASCIDVTEIEPMITGGVEPFEFQWFVADTAYSNTQSINIQSYETMVVVLQVTDVCGQFDEDNTIYFVPDIPIDVTVVPDTLICFGDFISTAATAVGGEGGFTYYWPELDREGETQTVGPLRDTTLFVVATDICGKTGIGSVDIDVQRLIVSFLSEEIETNLYQFTSTTNIDCTDCLYDWNFGDGSSALERDPLHEFDGRFEYTTQLVVTSEIGCQGFYHAPVVVPILLYVPNAFTPDQDGINDFFQVYTSGIDEFSIQIFNRWGEVVFASLDPNAIWDGSHQNGDYYVPNGTYVWLIEINGVNFDARKETGTVTILR